MTDTTPQTADGKVLLHFAMSLDGFVAGPDHAMDWMAGVSVRPGLHDEYIRTTGVFSPTIGRQLLGRGLIDEIDLHIVPVLLGDGVRLYDSPGSKPVRLHRAGDGDPLAAVNVRYLPVGG